MDQQNYVSSAAVFDVTVSFVMWCGHIPDTQETVKYGAWGSSVDGGAVSKYGCDGHRLTDGTIATCVRSRCALTTAPGTSQLRHPSAYNANKKR